MLFGNVQVVVPDDARVDTEGLLVFGGTDCEAACSGTGTRVVTVDARGAFGSVDVVRQGERVSREGTATGTTRTRRRLTWPGAPPGAQQHGGVDGPVEQPRHRPAQRQHDQDGEHHLERERQLGHPQLHGVPAVRHLPQHVSHS